MHVQLSKEANCLDFSSSELVLKVSFFDHWNVGVHHLESTIG